MSNIQLNIPNGILLSIRVPILNEVIANAFFDTLGGLQAEIDKIIESPGMFDDFPMSDIVDTSALLDKQGIKLTSPFTAEYDFGVDYAVFVHEGYTLKNGEIQPGRPWVNLALQNYNFQENFRHYLTVEAAQLGIII